MMGLCRLQSTHQFETNNRLQLQQSAGSMEASVWLHGPASASEEPPHTCPLGPARQDLIARTGLQDRPAGPACRTGEHSRYSSYYRTHSYLPIITNRLF